MATKSNKIKRATNSINILSSIKKTQIKDTGKSFLIEGIPVTVDNSVMNRVLYPKDENEKGLPSLIGKPLSLSHPEIDGEFATAREGKGLLDFFSGGVVTNVYRDGGIWYANAEIKKSLLKVQDESGRYEQALLNKDNIGVSTGLVFETNSESGKIEGEEYDHIAINQVYDHLALLLDEEPAGGEATVMRFNSKSKDIGVKIEKISNSQQQTNGVLKNKADDESALNLTNLKQDDVMRDLLLKKLQEAGVDGSNLSDEELLAEFSKLNTNNESKDEPKDEPKGESEGEPKEEADNKDEDTKDLGKLEERIANLESMLKKQDDEKNAPARNAVKAHFGLSDYDVSAMTTNALNALFAKTKNIAPLGGGQSASNSEALFNNYDFGEE